MNQCFLVAIFWRNNMQVLSAVRVCSGEPMSEKACRIVAVTVEGQMRLAEADLYFPELTNRIDLVELYAVDASVIGTLNSVDLWHQNFQGAVGTINMALITKLSFDRKAK